MTIPTPGECVKRRRSLRRIHRPTLKAQAASVVVLLVAFAALFAPLGLSYAARLALVLVPTVPSIVWAMRYRRRLARARAPIQELLARGAFAEAAEACTALALRHPANILNRRAAILADLGWAELRRGRLDEAAAALVEAEQFPKWNEEEAEARGLAAYALAALAALRGEEASATAWLEEAGRRWRTPPALSLWVTPLVLLRTGQEAEAARFLAENAQRAESAMHGEDLRTFRLLRAFAAGPDDRAPALITEARPLTPGGHAALAGAWPALREFLATYGL